MHQSPANELKTPLLMPDTDSEGSVHGASLASAASSTNSVAPLLPPESSAAAARERAERLRRRSPPPGVELVNAAPAADGGDDESDGDDGAPPLDLGKLVVSLATPLLVTFLLVLYLDAALAEGTSGMRGALSGMMVYTEDAADDAATIAWGVAENAGAVALWICAVTWLMYCLYKHRCYRVIYGWLVLSVAMLLGGTGGWVARLLLEKYEIPLDWPSACAAAAAQLVASRPRAILAPPPTPRRRPPRAQVLFAVELFGGGHDHRLLVEPDPRPGEGGARVAGALLHGGGVRAARLVAHEAAGVDDVGRADRPRVLGRPRRRLRLGPAAEDGRPRAGARRADPGADLPG